MLYRFVITIGVAMVLVACGGSQTSAPTAAPVPQSPEAVNTAWVNALKTNDRQAALALVGVQADARESFVDDILSRTQYMITKHTNNVTELGALQGVDVLSVADAGQGKVGYSQWRFEKVTFCRTAKLAAVGTEWKVIDWKTTTTCPAS